MADDDDFDGGFDNEVDEEPVDEDLNDLEPMDEDGERVQLLEVCFMHNILFYCFSPPKKLLLLRLNESQRIS